MRRNPPDRQPAAALTAEGAEVMQLRPTSAPRRRLVFRREHGRIIASLIRLCGSFDRAEEAMQEGFAAALANWSVRRSPGQSRRLDHDRRLSQADRRAPPRAHPPRKAGGVGAGNHARRDRKCPLIPTSTRSRHFPDDRLRLIFTCCHPALNREAQVALTLRTLGRPVDGRDRARLSRSRADYGAAAGSRQAQDPGRPHSLRGSAPRIGLPKRRAAVQAVIYLIFNEGYLATSGDALIRRELCAEAIRLGPDVMRDRRGGAGKPRPARADAAARFAPPRARSTMPACW